MKKACTSCKRELDKFGRKFPPKFPDGYLVPALAVDALVHKKDENGCKILLITRGKDSKVIIKIIKKKGRYAFPGGHVNYGEDLETACLRELKEECNIVGKNPKLFNVYGKPERDPRKHVITAVYVVECDNENDLQAGDDAATATFMDFRDVMEIPERFAFDHYEILSDYVKSKEGKP